MRCRKCDRLAVPGMAGEILCNPCAYPERYCGFPIVTDGIMPRDTIELRGPKNRVRIVNLKID
jgi:hypothetical protein